MNINENRIKKRRIEFQAIERLINSEKNRFTLIDSRKFGALNYSIVLKSEIFNITYESTFSHPNIVQFGTIVRQGVQHRCWLIKPSGTYEECFLEFCKIVHKDRRRREQIIDYKWLQD